MDINAIIAAKKFGKGGGGSIPKPIPYDYMPEGYPKKEIVIYAEEQTVQFSNGFATINHANLFSAGDTVKVIWDGTEYNITAYEFQGMAVGGNAGIFGGEDTGEPFVIAVDAGQGQMAVASKSETAVVSCIGEVITPMDSRFVVGGVKYCIFSQNDDETYSASMTYDEIGAYMLGGGMVVGVYGTELFYPVSANFMSDISAYGRAYEVVFEHRRGTGILMRFHVVEDGDVNFFDDSTA